MIMITSKKVEYLVAYATKLRYTIKMVVYATNCLWGSEEKFII